MKSFKQLYEETKAPKAKSDENNAAGISKNKKLVLDHHANMLKAGYKYSHSEERDGWGDDVETHHHYISKDGGHMKTMTYSSYAHGLGHKLRVGYTKRKLQTNHPDLKG